MYEDKYLLLQYIMWMSEFYILITVYVNSMSRDDKKSESIVKSKAGLS